MEGSSRSSVLFLLQAIIAPIAACLCGKTNCHVYSVHLYNAHLYSVHLYSEQLYNVHLYSVHLYSTHLYIALYSEHLYNELYSAPKHWILTMIHSVHCTAFEILR